MNPLLHNQDDHTSRKDANALPGWFGRNSQIIFIAAGQTTILVSGWSFLASIVYFKYIALPDHVAHYAYLWQSETTFIVGLVASAFAFISIWIYSLAIRLALTNRLIRNPMSLQFLDFSIKISRGSLFFDRKHQAWAWGSAMVWLAVVSSTAGWTSLLNPKTILLPGSVDGTELDLGSEPFAQYALQNMSPAIGTENSIAYTLNNALEVMDIGTLSGNSAGGARLRLPSFFNFNGASYNLSTGGILPAIPEFAEEGSMPTFTGFAFSGGSVLMNTTVDNFNLAGMSRNFTVNQQGLTANVSCSQQDLDDPSPFSLVSTSVSYAPPNSVAGYTAGYLFWLSRANCSYSAAKLNYFDQNYITLVDDCAGSGFLPVISCPMQDASGPNNNSFTIVMRGECKYDFIPPTICEVTPIVTEVAADYNNGIITSQSPLSYYALGGSNPAALSFIVGITEWIGARAQGTIGNSIGDSVFLIKSTQKLDSTTSNATTNMILEDYWRGVVEFGGTFIRSGFSAEGTFENDIIPPNMTRAVHGESYVLTMGWSYQPAGTLVTLLPQTVIALLTFVVLAMTGRNTGALRNRFDPTDVNDVILSTTSNRAGLAGVPVGKLKQDRIEKEKIQLVEDDGRTALKLKY
ncbi:hypothetical protein CONPUDRAFT_91026 [Coniophora puteana RWD-64-598 SS2]|uniref:Uncharacterized protein n=1 Tax=Coniophora puteana (strain RWD-64-598) TaxID=741705 RepID=A0A5M3MLM8_CONPW|nr:uncharacterized protein CONPUDRAFT_91026 [Coniophora puteana RWD-64-598 SS2]EIW79694.1 hypothetical protein CONPUDRAFT_91026 [Coniophora puteana RWD-64-598 SS2]